MPRSIPSVPRRGIVAVLAAFLLVVQWASPPASPTIQGKMSDHRLAALAHAVGHAVETCHHRDDGQVPADDAAPCCPCALCHVLPTALPSAPALFTSGQPVFGYVVLYPQPPPHSAAKVRLASAGPRGPPHLV